MVQWSISYPQGTLTEPNGDSVTVKYSYLTNASDWNTNIAGKLGTTTWTQGKNNENIDERIELAKRLMAEGSGLTVDNSDVDKAPFYTFPTSPGNPIRLDIKESHWLNTFPIPFRERAIALSFGQNIGDITWNCRFTDRDEFEKFRSVLLSKRDEAGRNAMAEGIEEPEIIPFILLMGYVDEANTVRELRFAYYESMTQLREARRGDNIKEVQVHFKDVTPHIYSVDATTVNYDVDPDGAVLYYPELGKDREKRKVYDQSGHGNHGTITSAPKVVDGVFGKALDFDGSNDVIDIGSTGETVKSVNVWVYPDSVTSIDIIDFDGGTHSVEVGEATVGTITATGFSSPTIYVDGSAGSTLATGSWQMITVTTATGFTASDLDIGSETSFFDGKIDAFKMWPRVLTTTEITALNTDGTAFLSQSNAGQSPTKPESIRVEGKAQVYVDQEQTTNHAVAQPVGEADATTKSNKIAQSFVPTKKKLRGFHIDKHADTGTFTGSVTFSIFDDDSGSPSIDLSSVDLTNDQWTNFNAGSNFIYLPYRLTPDTKYHLHVSTSTSDTSNHPNLGAYNTDAYAEGSLKDWSTADGWATINQDLYFVQEYYESTRNPTWNIVSDPETKYRVGKESVDQSQPNTDGTIAGIIMNASSDWNGFTFQPDQTSITKIKVRADLTGTAVGNLRVRLFEYDTSSHVHTGSVLATTFFPVSQSSTTTETIVIPLEATGLDTTKTYVVLFDDNLGDGSNYWTLYGLTTTGLGDTSVGRTITSTNSGSSYTESTLIQALLETYYGDFKSVEIMQSEGGRGLFFDGTYDYVDVGNDATLDFGSGSSTHSMWLKSLTDNQTTIFYKHGRAGTNPQIQLYLGTGRLKCDIEDNSANTANFADDAGDTDGGAWHHIVVVLDRSGDTGTRYFDGVVSGSTLDLSGLSDTTDTADNDLIGATRSSGGTVGTFFHGIIDDVRIYDVALSATEVASLYAQTKSPVVLDTNGLEDSDLVAWWKFDEDDGLMTYDISGNDNDGDLIGSPIWISGRVESNSASHITTRQDGQGQFFYEDDFSTQKFWIDAEDFSDGTPVYDSDGFLDLNGLKSITYKIITPYPTKKAVLLDYVIDVVTDQVTIETSTDNSTWTIERIINASDDDDNVRNIITLSSDNTKGQTLCYVKFSTLSGDRASLKYIKLTAPLDCSGAEFPSLLQGDNILRKSQDEISGHQKTTVIYRERD